MGSCPIDAKCCYDRIIHSFAALAMRRLEFRERSRSACFSRLGISLIKVEWASEIQTDPTVPQLTNHFKVKDKATEQTWLFGLQLAPHFWNSWCREVAASLGKRSRLKVYFCG